MTVREQTEQIEAQTLSPFASLSRDSRGRQRPERPCPVRTAFQRDRDRIIHSKAFRRLTHKTQVFIAPEQDHYRTRLTHTLEVAQIARTIARALRLNEDLTEAIALGHDLGHTPFGHAGEWALDEIYREFDPRARFRHYEQSVRVVEAIENGGRGLNLTWEVRDGIRHHSKGRDDLPLTRRHGAAALEGRVVTFADRIAYVNHDIDDAVRAGIITRRDLPAQPLAVLGSRHSTRISTMVTDVITRSAGKPRVTMSREVLDSTNALKDFLFERVYSVGSGARDEMRKVAEVIENLFRYYMAHPDGLPNGRSARGRRALARHVCDHLAGMTDRYARSQFARHFLPTGWRAS